MKTSIFNKLILSIMAVLILSNIYAQKKEFDHMRKKDRKKIEAMRIAFITDVLSLKPGEAEKFWPVYNEFKDKKHEKHETFKQKHDELLDEKDIEEMSEQEATELYNLHRTYMQTMHELEMEYMAKFKEVIPVKKVVLLKKAEDGFKKHLLRELRGRHKPPHERTPDKPPHAPHEHGTVPHEPPPPQGPPGL